MPVYVRGVDPDVPLRKMAVRMARANEEYPGEISREIAT
jgi:hypothetical protein